MEAPRTVIRTATILLAAATSIGCGGDKPHEPARTPAPESPAGCALSIPAEGARAVVSDVAGLLAPTFTVEFWFKVDDQAWDINDPSTFLPHRLVAARSTGGGVWYAGIDPVEASVTCALYEPGPAGVSLAARHDAPPSSDGFHHVACELGGSGIGLWFDGELADWEGTLLISGTRDPLFFEHDGLPIVLGQGDGASPLEPEPLVRFAGAIDEVRFSDGMLYAPRTSATPADTFTPELKASVLDTTTALFHFDECSGSVAADSGPDGHDATLENGAKWLRRPEQPP